MTLRRAVLRTCLGLGGAAVAAAPAQAQIAPGYSGFSSTRYITGEAEVARSIWAFGLCFGRSHPDRAAQLLATAPNSAEEARTFRNITKGGYVDCLNDLSRLRAPMPLLRGAIAEGYYRSGRPAPAEIVLPPLAADAPISSYLDIARCYAADHPAEVRALVVESEPASKQETAAARVISRGIGACIPEGLEFSIDNISLRYLLAEAALRTPAAPAYAGKN